FGTAAEEVEFEDEDVSEEVAAKFGDQFARGRRRPACKGAQSAKIGVFWDVAKARAAESTRSRTGRDDVVNDENLLAGLHAIGLHLEKILSVFLLVARRLGGARQLALLAHRDEASAQPEGKRRPKQKAPRLQADNDVGLPTVGFQDVQFEGAQ